MQMERFCLTNLKKEKYLLKFRLGLLCQDAEPSMKDMCEHSNECLCNMKSSYFLYYCSDHYFLRNVCTLNLVFGNDCESCRE